MEVPGAGAMFATDPDPGGVDAGLATAGAGVLAPIAPELGSRLTSALEGPEPPTWWATLAACLDAVAACLEASAAWADALAAAFEAAAAFSAAARAC
ncbi:MAG: hypothetical protein WBQ86_20565 [Candidatus Binatus sp.]